MYKLEQKLKNIQALLKAEMPSIKKPKPPTPPKPPSAQKPTAPKANQALSSKDPTKVAEQIKDPSIDRDATLKEAKKIKEGVSFNKRGQWSLTKWDDNDWDNAAKWSESGMRRHLDKLPAAEGDTRKKMMGRLGDTGVETKDIDGEKHYKLFRYSKENAKHHEKGVTSWTTDQEFTDHWHEVNKDVEDWGRGQTMHAWIPESKIHSFLGGSEHPDMLDENEVLVHPHKPIISQVDSHEDLDDKINKGDLDKVFGVPLSP